MTGTSTFTQEAKYLCAEYGENWILLTIKLRTS